MKYFDIEEKEGTICSYSQLKTVEEFHGNLNCEELRRVLEEQLRPLGLQPVSCIDGSGFEIVAASKKFLRRDGRYNQIMSKKALKYMAFCEGTKPEKIIERIIQEKCERFYKK